MKLLTLNTHSIAPVECCKLSEQERMDWLCKYIVEEQPDVVCLQEVNQSISSPLVSNLKLESSGYLIPELIGDNARKKDIREDNYALELVLRLREIGKVCNWSWSFAHIGFDNFEEGVAIISFLPTSNARAVSVSSKEYLYSWQNRVQTGIQIEPPAKTGLNKNEHHTIWLYSVQFGWWNRTAMEPFQSQWDNFEKYVNQPTIVAGDFNNEEGQDGWSYITINRHWNDCSARQDGKKRQSTIITDNSHADGWDDTASACIDFVMSNYRVQTVSTRPIFNGQNYPVISDHTGLEVVLNC